ESSIIPIRDVIFEHRLYLPSSGLISSFLTGLFISAERLLKEKSRNFLIVFIASVLIIFSALTINRNMLWQDGVSIWKDTIEKSPFKSRPYSNLANLYQEKRMYAEAENNYLKAIELSPSSSGLHNNLGNVYKAQARYTEAINEYTKAIDLDPKFAEAYFNLGVTLSDLGQKENALFNLNKAIEFSPLMFDAYISLGNVYDDMGRKAEALEAYTKSLEINPYSYMAYYNRGIFYERIGDIENAKKDYFKALELNPGWDLPGNQLERLGRDDRSRFGTSDALAEQKCRSTPSISSCEKTLVKDKLINAICNKQPVSNVDAMKKDLNA
ncbi:MAG: tetratricopeptide repeat protein, partial [Nitrospiraceae bacterium]|nr:tetratricopeptide repeat protein [Nitrospiraceae bacterium]